MIIDAKDMILGRIATVAAKKALMGEKVDIVNCENVIITGTKEHVLERFKAKVKKGIPLKGPYYPRRPDMIVRRTVRGMLPHRQEKGRKAYKKVMCYMGVPEIFQGKKLETIKEANFSKCPTLRYVRLKEICREIGGLK